MKDLIDKLHDIYRDCEPYDPFDAVTEITKFLFLKYVNDVNRWNRLNMDYIRRQLREHPGKSVRKIFNEMLEDALSYYRGVPELREFNIRNDETFLHFVKVLQGYTLDYIGWDVLGSAYERLLQTLFRGQLGQFFTPRPVINFMVELANPRIDPETGSFDSVIDPFAGSCGFLVYYIMKAKSKGALKEVSQRVMGIEKSPRIAFVGAVNLLIHGGDPRKVHVDDTLRQVPQKKLSDGTELGNYDVVLTNPPFGSEVRDKSIVAYYSESRGVNHNEIEAVSLWAMLDLVKEGGKIVTVVPESLMKNPEFSDLRSRLKKEAVIRAYISLPLSAFLAYGSSMKTGVLYIVKRGEGVKEGRVFFDSARYVGIDRVGNPIEKNDLPLILQRFKLFEEGKI
jgi:type I restriction enzyme M protein